MKIIIGKQALQLEELFYASHLCQQAEIQLDESVNKVLDTKGRAAKEEPSVFTSGDKAEPGNSIEFKQDQIRAIVFVKLIQLLKLKSNATKISVELLTGLFADVKSQEYQTKYFFGAEDKGIPFNVWLT